MCDPPDVFHPGIPLYACFIGVSRDVVVAEVGGRGGWADSSANMHGSDVGDTFFSTHLPRTGRVPNQVLIEDVHTLGGVVSVCVWWKEE